MSKEIKPNSFRIEIEEDLPTITEITWKNQGGEVESIDTDFDEEEVVVFRDDCENTATYYRKDLPKILKAVEKAIELGWHRV